MATMRLVHQENGSRGLVRVYHDRDHQEFVCQLWERKALGLLHVQGADYFTDDKADAISTARVMARDPGDDIADRAHAADGEAMYGPPD